MSIVTHWTSILDALSPEDRLRLLEQAMGQHPRLRTPPLDAPETVEIGPTIDDDRVRHVVIGMGGAGRITADVIQREAEARARTERIHEALFGHVDAAALGALPDIPEIFRAAPPARPGTPPPPPPPYEPTSGERQLARDVEAAGWTGVAIVPPGERAYGDVPGSIEVVAVDGPDADWHIRVDGGGDGRVEGFEVVRGDGGGESSGRLPGSRVPTPNEAVGAWEAQRRSALEAARPRGRKG